MIDPQFLLEVRGYLVRWSTPLRMKQSHLPVVREAHSIQFRRIKRGEKLKGEGKKSNLHANI